MKIDSIEVRYVAMPLKYPWRTAYGEDWDIHSVLVRMTSGEHAAWGEASPLQAPTYSPETAMSVFHNIKEFFAPRLVGEEIESADALNERLALFKGNPFAKAGVEVAWWMLSAAIQGEPLHRLLGAAPREVDAGADFGVQDSIDMLLGNIQGALDLGHRRVKLKVRPGWDLEMLRAVRATFPGATFHIDCNSGYTLDDLPFFKEVDKLGLAMIEQPLFHTDLLEHAELQRRIETPVCLDESLKSVRDMEWAIRLKSCRYVNIKPGRVGGLQNALVIHNLARDAGIPAWVGGMLESGIGAGICVELAMLGNFTYPADLFPSERFYEQDLTEPALVMTDRCTFLPSTVPGIPQQPVPERVERVTREKAVIGRTE
ncbi:MAG: o-succinylbenzoate synthase [Armatimonadetes bacterium]|nr:o-succinylbenzoate synthase [Armatimonadota bacterium]